MRTRPRTIVIVGASLAGGTAAGVLRDEGFGGRVILVGEEPYPPYERPPLSKEYLRGESGLDKALLRPLEAYEERGIETVFGVRAARIDPADRAVELEDGTRVRCDKVLIATGGRNRMLDVPGARLDGVLYLRTVADADRIRALAAAGARAVVVGMGFIGAEVAASLRQCGLDVTAVEPFPAPLYRALGEKVGRSIARLHRDHGVDVVLGEAVSAFEGAGRVERVITDSGRRVDCDFAVVGVGITPDAGVAEGSGVAVDNGIVVDELCRTTVEGLYACGDVANHFHPLFGRRIRVEHWQNAIKQGAAAARSMLGKGEPYADVHWFWSDQYEANVQYAGFHTSWDELVVRGSLEDADFIAFYLNNGGVDAAAALNRGRDIRAAMRLIRARAPVDPARLADEDTDLRKLVAAGRRDVS